MHRIAAIADPILRTTSPSTPAPANRVCVEAESAPICLPLPNTNQELVSLLIATAILLKAVAIVIHAIRGQVSGL